MDNSNKDYTGYSQWKLWNSRGSFGELTETANDCFDGQLRRLQLGLKSGERICEFGFGGGSFLRYCVTKGCAVVGIEIQEDLLSDAKNAGYEVYPDKKLAGERFDKIFAFDVIEHLTILEIRDFFEWASNSLADDGALVLRFPNGDSYEGLGAFNGDITHITFIGKSKLLQLLSPTKLVLVQYEGEYHSRKGLVVDAVRMISRALFRILLGTGNNYFFSANVIAVIRIDEHLGKKNKA